MANPMMACIDSARRCVLCPGSLRAQRMFKRKRTPLGNLNVWGNAGSEESVIPSSRSLSEKNDLSCVTHKYEYHV